VGLRIPAGLPFDVWERAGYRLTQVMDSSAWCIGDWTEHGKREFEDRYRRVIDTVGPEYQAVRNYA
jgi:hypothetical protein